MHKVILVDDDYPVLELLSHIIPWQELGLQLTGCYTNASEALHRSEASVPDIVITDIGMPEIDGIELIRMLKRRHPDLRTVILSCHDDFKYAQQAVKMEVNDYILKESLNPVQVIEILGRLKTSLDEEKRRSRQWEHLTRAAEQNKTMMKNQFFRAMLLNPIANREEWQTQAESYQLFLKTQFYYPVLCYLNGYAQEVERFGNSDTLSYAIENVANEVLDKQGVVFRYETVLYLLLPRNDKRYGWEYEELMASLRELQRAWEKYLKLKFSFIAGEPCNRIVGLKDQLLELYRTPRFYNPALSISRLQEVVSFSSQDPFQWFSEALDEFRGLVMDEAGDRIEMAVRRWMAKMEQAFVDPERLKDWTLKIVMDLQVKFNTLNQYRSTYSIEILHRKAAAIENIQELSAWLIRFLEDSVHQVLAAYKQIKKQEVYEAIQWIDRHLDRKILLDEVADYLHLSPSYFSRLFKRETGRNFIEYVTREKMERAKHYLDETQMTVDDIAYGLGYDNKSYFLKVFKNHTTLTPQEYRGQRQGFRSD